MHLIALNLFISPKTCIFIITALQTCSILQNACKTAREAPCEMKCLSKNKDNATLQWALTRSQSSLCDVHQLSCNHCNPMKLIHPSARAHARHFLRFSSQLLYILASIRPSIIERWVFCKCFGGLFVSELFLWVKTAVLDEQFAHAPRWLSIGLARCIVNVSQQAIRLTKRILNLLVFTFVFLMNAEFHLYIQYTIVFVYLITLVDKESENNVGWRSLEMLASMLTLVVIYIDRFV